MLVNIVVVAVELVVVDIVVVAPPRIRHIVTVAGDVVVDEVEGLVVVERRDCFVPMDCVLIDH